MKKILITIMSAFAACLTANAQVTFSPGTFTADDQVTLTVDVSGTPLAGQADAYIWIWANPGGVGPAPNGTVNGDWGNSSAAAKMTAAGTNKWSFTFTGTTLFGLTPGDLHDFGFLVKAKDGSKQTADFKPFKFDPLTFTPNKLRVFPSKVGKDDVVTVFFEQALGTTLEEQRMKPLAATIFMYDETNAAVGSPLTINARKVADNIWAVSFIPSDSFTPAGGHKLARFTYHFSGTVLGTTGSPQTATTADASVDFTEMK